MKKIKNGLPDIALFFILLILLVPGTALASSLPGSSGEDHIVFITRVYTQEDIQKIRQDTRSLGVGIQADLALGNMLTDQLTIAYFPSRVEGQYVRIRIPLHSTFGGQSVDLIKPEMRTIDGDLTARLANTQNETIYQVGPNAVKEILQLFEEFREADTVYLRDKETVFCKINASISEENIEPFLLKKGSIIYIDKNTMIVTIKKEYNTQIFTLKGKKYQKADYEELTKLKDRIVSLAGLPVADIIRDGIRLRHEIQDTAKRIEQKGPGTPAPPVESKVGVTVQLPEWLANPWVFWGIMIGITFLSPLIIFLTAMWFSFLLKRKALNKEMRLSELIGGIRKNSLFRKEPVRSLENAFNIAETHIQLLEEVCRHLQDIAGDNTILDIYDVNKKRFRPKSFKEFEKQLELIGDVKGQLEEKTGNEIWKDACNELSALAASNKLEIAVHNQPGQDEQRFRQKFDELKGRISDEIQGLKKEASEYSNGIDRLKEEKNALDTKLKSETGEFKLKNEELSNALQSLQDQDKSRLDQLKNLFKLEAGDKQGDVDTDTWTNITQHIETAKKNADLAAETSITLKNSLSQSFSLLEQIFSNLNAIGKFQKQQEKQADAGDDTGSPEIGALQGISDTLKMNLETLITVSRNEINASLANNVKASAELAARSLQMALLLKKSLMQDDLQLYGNVAFKILDNAQDHLFDYSRKLEQLKPEELSLPKAAELIFYKPHGEEHYLFSILDVLRGIMILRNYRPVWDKVDMRIKSSLMEVDGFTRKMLDHLGFDLHQVEVKKTRIELRDNNVEEENDEQIIEDDYLKTVLAKLYNTSEIDKDTIVDVRVLGYNLKPNGALAEINGEIRKSVICFLSETQLKRNAEFYNKRGNK